MKKIKGKIKEFWLKNDQKIILMIGFVLIAIISLEIGIIQGKNDFKNPLIIEKPINFSNQLTTSQKTQNIKSLSEKKKISSVNLKTPVSSQCAYVASKNSHTYHLPNCRWVKRIKAKNKICFKSKKEAQSKGYLPDKGC